MTQIVFFNHCNIDKDYVKQKGVKDLAKTCDGRLRTMFGESRQEKEKNPSIEQYIKQMVTSTTIFNGVTEE